MANNNLIFDAALAGASGGAASRWLTKQVNTDYDAIAASMVVFATAIDTAVGFDPTVTQQDAMLMQAICEQVFAGRWPPTASTLDLLTMQNIALSVKAMWTRLRAENLPVSPGASLPNLATVWYADAGTSVPLADRTGNIEAPFGTLAAAIAAAAAGDTIICVGNFTATITVGKALKFAAIAEGTKFTITGTFDTTAAVAIELDGASITGAVTLFTGSTLNAVRSDFGSIITGAGSTLTAKDCDLPTLLLDNANLTNCTINGNSTLLAGSIQTWNNCHTVGQLTAGDFTGINCSFGIIIGSGPTFLHGCSIAGAVSAITELTADECTFAAAVTCSIATSLVDCEVVGTLTANAINYANGCTFAGVSIGGATANNRFVGCKYTSLAGVGGSSIDCDSYSASWAAVTGGLVRTIDAPRATLSVTVPVLIAGAIGTATQVCTGTVLAGITVNQQVAANEPTGGVTGGGFLGSARVSATNTILFTFMGPTAGGAQNFIVTQI